MSAFQLYLSRYINAYDGLTQVRALLGKDIPADLADYDKFLTVSFRYFAAAIELFSDKTAMEMYEDRAGLLKQVPLCPIRPFGPENLLPQNTKIKDKIKKLSTKYKNYIQKII
jgi:hypothetical protein